jgi:PAS domain-containing protein
MIAGGTEALTSFVVAGDLENRVFREMVEALPVAIYTTDAEGRLTYYNSAAKKLSGRTPEIGTDKWWRYMENFPAGRNASVA